MNILILGGKKFLGYYLATIAKEKGHEVTFFNRGKTYSDLLPEIPTIIGDRNTDLDLLKNKHFDAVIDTCAYLPKDITKSTNILADNIDNYILISTISVCDLSIIEFNENMPITNVDYTSEEVIPQTYGPLKAACEQETIKNMGENKSLIIRPGFIVGSRDHTDRFTFWPVMMNQLDKMIVPQANDVNFQCIDVRDLAKFIIQATEKNLHGTYQVTGPVEPYKFSQFIEDCHKTVNPNCELIKVDEDWFDKNGIEKAAAFPLYCNYDDCEGVFKVDISKAISAGLTTRPMTDTIKDALDWFNYYKNDISKLGSGINIDEFKKLINKEA